MRKASPFRGKYLEEGMGAPESDMEQASTLRRLRLSYPINTPPKTTKIFNRIRQWIISMQK